MRRRPGLALAFACLAVVAFDNPAAARPHARADARHHAPAGVRHPDRKRAVQPAPQQPAARPTRTAVETARSLWVSARARTVPALVEEARKYIGTNPTERKRLWCARFMNFVLAKLGYAGTNSDAAKSFAEYGHRIGEPRVGAIAVLTRGPRGGHVGIVSGVDANGNPIIISGNHSPHGVGEGVYARARVIAYVMPSERRAVGRAEPAAQRGIESPFEALAAALQAEQPRARAPATVAPAAPVAQAARRQAAPAVPHRTVQQTPDQRAEGGVSNPISELMNSFDRAPAQRHGVM